MSDRLSRLFGLALLVLISLASGVGGAAAWGAYANHRAAVAERARQADEAAAAQALRTDPAACTRTLPAAGDACAALIRFDRAAQEISGWAEPVDRPVITNTLNDIRDVILNVNAPRFVRELDWIEEAALRRARALESAIKLLEKENTQEQRVAMSARLSDILQKRLLQDSNAP